MIDLSILFLLYFIYFELIEIQKGCNSAIL